MMPNWHKISPINDTLLNDILQNCTAGAVLGGFHWLPETTQDSQTTETSRILINAHNAFLINACHCHV